MMTKPTAEQVTFKSQGLGAVTRTLQDKLSETISVKDFGAVGDGVADDTAAIQAAIDWAMYRNLPFNTSVTWNIPSVFFPTGRYKVSDTIHLGYGDTFRTVHIRGDGRRFVNGSTFGGTSIVPTFNDRPVFAISGGRSNSIRDMTIFGQNNSWITTQKLGSYGTPLIDDLVESNWVDPSFPASASSRYAPYCAIAIDPYAGPRPAVSYPDVNFPSWLNYTTQYGKNLSSECHIRDVEINGFVVGVAVQPSDFDGNGDFIKVYNSIVERCQFGFSVGNTQARDHDFSNINGAKCFCFITTSRHGRKNGKPAFSCVNSSFGAGIWWAIMDNMQFGGTVAFRNCYAESLWGIGQFSAPGTGAGEMSVTFDKCEFGFDLWDYRGIPQSPIVSNTAVTFIGCVFATHNPNPSGPRPNMLVLTCTASQCNFINCNVFAGNQPQFLYEKVAINATAGMVLRNLETNLPSWSVRAFQYWNVVTGAPINPGLWNQTSVPYERFTCIPVYAKHVYCNDWDYGVPFPRLSFPFGKSTITSISQSGRTVTADLTGNRTAFSLATRGGDVGDVVYDQQTGTAFIVSARTGTTIEMVAQNNLDASNNLAVTITTVGNFNYLMCRVFALGSVHYGDLSSSSATISNVVGADGVSRSVDSATLGVQAGDYAIGGNGAAIGIASGSNAEIASVTSNTIVLSGNARYTATRERLTYFIKQATANNT
jgi:hypothetical protein